MIDFAINILLVLFAISMMALFFMLAFGDTETAKAIDSKIAKWIKGADDEVH